MCYLSTGATFSTHPSGFRLIGRRSTRDALGARVTLVSGDRRLIRETRSGGSYLSQSDLRILFGLGSLARIDRVEIRWPRGGVQTLSQVRPNRYHTILEPLRRKLDNS